MESEIKFGDRVKLVRPSPRTKKNHPSLLVGEEGAVVHVGYGYDVLLSGVGKLFWTTTVRTEWTDQLFYGIEWRNLITNGHDCQGNCKKGHGSYLEAYEIEKI
jgi:hypothetical protein